MTPTPQPRRRACLHLAGGWFVATGLGVGAGRSRAQTPATPFPQVSEGPFYPPSSWRQQAGGHRDWDADLTTVRRHPQTLRAQGEHLGLHLQVVDTDGRRIDAAEVEIWQCDVRAVYQHPDVRVAPDARDPGFQGFGASSTGAAGEVSFRTIRPVNYPGRTPHIHIKLRHTSFGEWTSQLFVADDPGNARDGLWRRLSAAGRDQLSLRLQPTAEDRSGLRWTTRHRLVLPA